MANNKSASSAPSRAGSGVAAAGAVAAAIAAVPQAAQAEITRQEQERAAAQQELTEHPPKLGTPVLRSEVHVMRDGALTVLPAGTPVSKLTKEEQGHHAIKRVIGSAGIDAPGERARTVDDLEGMTDEVAHLSFGEQTGAESRVSPGMTREAQIEVGARTAQETGLPLHNQVGMTEAQLRALPAEQQEAMSTVAGTSAKSGRK